MKLLLLLSIVTFASCDRIVTTTNGPVKGTSLSPKKVVAFLGIPYAEPPVGPLRFAKPVPKSFWEELYLAKEFPPSCMQFPLGDLHYAPDPNGKMSEDCLYLNIWVPEGGSDAKPIMLFIHGGGFVFGSSNTRVYDGANLSEHGDVIVVTINYRVGTLGFFSGFVEDAAGNMGMYDQVMAIQWIKDNAKHFGGDPDNILLFGESAGGFSTSMHLISPLSKGLFRRAILQSGTVVSPLFKNNDALQMMSQYTASLLGCADENNSLNKNPQSVINCMKDLPAEKFIQGDGILMKSGVMMLPRIGDSFLPESTLDTYKNGNFKDTEIMLGVTSNEGALLLTMNRENAGWFGEKVEVQNFNETSARQYLKHFTQNSDIYSGIIQEYFDRVKMDPGYTYLQATADIIGDLIITCGAVFQADYYSLRDNPVYFYVFDYRPDSTPLPEWMGAAHFDEMQYVFGNPMHQEFTGYEKEFSGDIMDMWVAFAKTGNPNIPGSVEWPRYSFQDPKYLVLSKRDRVDVKPDNNRCESWRKIFETEITEDTLEKFKKEA
uniref:Carboxylic ester hydrolase n=1 Tax=Pardosa pseudoannulata TaxID=330961 RepID=A0A1B1FIV7_9ARAC|nr:AChE6 [Pardosa pseudoannulata]